MMKRSSVMSPFLITITICVSGLIWQLYNLGSHYFKYEVVSEISIHKNDSRRPPAFTLCLPFIDIIDWKKLSDQLHFNSSLYKKYQESNGRITEQEYKRLTIYVQETLTVRQLNELTPDLNELLISSWIRKPGTFRILKSKNGSTIPEDVKVVKFIRDNCVCYKFFNVNSIKSNFSLQSYHIAYGLNRGVHLELKFAKDGIMNRIVIAYIFLLRILIYPRGDRDYPIILTGARNSQNVFHDDASSWSITYSKVIIDLLPKPYVTDCVDYLDIGYENEAHCTHSCTNDYYLSRYFKSIFTASVIDDKYMNVSKIGKLHNSNKRFHVHQYQNIWYNDTDHDHPAISRYSVVGDSSKEKELDKVLEECQRKCSNIGCHRIYYIPTVTGKTDDDKFIIFKLYAMSQPEIKLVSKVKDTTENFIVSVISAIGVWIGISCIDIVTSILVMIKRQVKE